MPNRKYDCKPIFSPEDADLSDLVWWFDPYKYAHRVRRVNGKLKPLKAHHAVAIRMYGRKPDWSKRETIDHKNGNRLDNRRENLEMVHLRENARRVHKKKEGLMWTSYFCGSWRYHIWIGDRVRWKSGFKTTEEAHAAAKAMLNQHEAEQGREVPDEWKTDAAIPS